MKITFWSLFVSISCSYEYILASTYDLTSDNDNTLVRDKRSVPLQSSNECLNENCFINNQPRNEDESKLPTQKSSNEDLIFNTHEYGEPHYFRNSPDISLIKRATQGFIGVRGKKEYERTDYEKRRPTGFQGVRGKKFYLNYPISFTPPKRLPSGFQGVRGKKDSNDSEMDDELMQLLYALSIKQRYLEYLRQREIIENTMDKDQLDMQTTDNSYNRMNDIADSNLDETDVDKRAPLGFQGVRGKKDVTNVLRNLAIEKRATAGFYGMRGKKLPSDTRFFGMRGKKVPYDLRSKFVGVRGKKASDDANIMLPVYHEMAQD